MLRRQLVATLGGVRASLSAATRLARTLEPVRFDKREAQMPRSVLEDLFDRSEGGPAFAAVIYRALGEYGEQGAACNLAILLYSGDYPSVPYDPNTALIIWERLARNNHATSYLHLGRSRESKGDIEGAIQLWERAAAAGNVQGYVHIGKLVPEDKGKARIYLEKAVAGGSPEAKFMLSLYLRANEGGSNDADVEQREQQLLAEAASGGNPSALYNFGVRAFKGDGLPKDRQYALECWTKAAGFGVGPSPDGIDELQWPGYRGMGNDVEIPLKNWLALTQKRGPEATWARKVLIKLRDENRAARQLLGRIAKERREGLIRTYPLTLEE
ncbi:hypothetical protein THASP1DRAFT_29194 [Thamnocephalis sphaerospora]|uniref:HCP-like protein n=1 Tax=Thamnocephalis sphaerospora TaxID=78915 RepID=A0A4P9XSA4_9FUNG|nr:hypothetical protein THASP1DRAFT_29194 [Thamnocephalis sphaerospora]|eukprot:RKP09003.1 hypothetical protein THASP1DRAFT_29194 [Thamnocephalis sphaerospora]